MSIFNQKEKYWIGPDFHRNSIYNPNNGIGDIIYAGLKNNLNKISQISEEHQLTCQQILNRAVIVADNLKNHHYIKQGDVISLISRNNDDVTSIVFGAFFIGATLNTLDCALDEHDLLHILGNVKPKLIFVDILVVDKIQKCLEKLELGTKIFLFGQNPENIYNNCQEVYSLYEEPDIIAPNSYPVEKISTPDTTTALILCSSGITGPNKMICLTHSQLISGVIRTWDWSITSQDICFTFSSLFWVSGIANLLIATAKGATRVITTKSFAAETLFNLINKYRITQMCLPSSCISDFLLKWRDMEEEHSNYDLSCLKSAIIGGSSVIDQFKDDLRQMFGMQTKIYEVYGFIELGSIAASSLYGKKKGSVGVVACQNMIKIINEKGKSLGVGEVGEICAKNPSKFMGYYNNEELTKQTIDSSGWIKSGDLGYFDEDGYLFVKGKIKELIRCKDATVIMILFFHYIIRNHDGFKVDEIETDEE